MLDVFARELEEHEIKFGPLGETERRHFTDITFPTNALARVSLNQSRPSLLSTFTMTRSRTALNLSRSNSRNSASELRRRSISPIDSIVKNPIMAYDRDLDEERDSGISSVKSANSYEDFVERRHADDSKRAARNAKSTVLPFNKSTPAGKTRIKSDSDLKSQSDVKSNSSNKIIVDIPIDDRKSVKNNNLSEKPSDFQLVFGTDGATAPKYKTVVKIGNSDDKSIVIENVGGYNGEKYLADGKRSSDPDDNVSTYSGTDTWVEGPSVLRLGGGSNRFQATGMSTDSLNFKMDKVEDDIETSAV